MESPKCNTRPWLIVAHGTGTCKAQGCKAVRGLVCAFEHYSTSDGVHLTSLDRAVGPSPTVGFIVGLLLPAWNVPVRQVGTSPKEGLMSVYNWLTQCSAPLPLVSVGASDKERLYGEPYIHIRSRSGPYQM